MLVRYAITQNRDMNWKSDKLMNRMVEGVIPARGLETHSRNAFIWFHDVSRADQPKNSSEKQQTR